MQSSSAPETAYDLSSVLVLRKILEAVQFSSQTLWRECLVTASDAQNHVLNAAPDDNRCADCAHCFNHDARFCLEMCWLR